MTITDCGTRPASRYISSVQVSRSAGPGASHSQLPTWASRWVSASSRSLRRSRSAAPRSALTSLKQTTTLRRPSSAGGSGDAVALTQRSRPSERTTRSTSAAATRCSRRQIVLGYSSGGSGEPSSRCSTQAGVRRISS